MADIVNINGEKVKTTPSSFYLFVTTTGDMLLNKGEMVANPVFVAVRDGVDTPAKMVIPLRSLSFAKEITEAEYNSLQVVNSGRQTEATVTETPQVANPTSSTVN